MELGTLVGVWESRKGEHSNAQSTDNTENNDEEDTLAI
jgi:hypothetical protein